MELIYFILLIILILFVRYSRHAGVLNVIAPFIKLEDELIFVGMMYKHIGGLTAMPVKYFTFESSWNI
jgi:hypothetical protein